LEFFLFEGKLGHGVSAVTQCFGDALGINDHRPDCRSIPLGSDLSKRRAKRHGRLMVASPAIGLEDLLTADRPSRRAQSKQDEKDSQKVSHTCTLCQYENDTTTILFLGS